jgi:GTP-binding protein
MRREGFELCVGRPEVIFKKVDNKLLEPIEHVYIDCEDTFSGVVTEKLLIRRGQLINMVNKGTKRVRLEFYVPSRGLIGYRDEFLSDTKGTGIINSYLLSYEEHKGEVPTRFTGSLVSDRSGKAVAYALYHLESRGRLFVTPGDDVYEGMIIGEYNKMGDLAVNPTKEKKLTNLRASGKDENIILRPVVPLTLEQALHFIAEDEMVEVTPKSIRLRKVELSSSKRQSMYAKKKG